MSIAIWTSIIAWVPFGFGAGGRKSPWVSNNRGTYVPRSPKCWGQGSTQE